MGSKRVFMRKGPGGERWTTANEARAALRAMLADSARGEFIEPSRQTLGPYGREVIEGLRIGPQTRASYLKNWRNHVEPYPIALLALGQTTGLKLTAMRAISANYKPLTSRYPVSEGRSTPLAPRYTLPVNADMFL
jgi:hypothetical protein